MKTIDNFIEEITEELSKSGLIVTPYPSHLEISIKGIPIVGLHYYPTKGGYTLMVEEEELFQQVEEITRYTYLNRILLEVEKYIHLFPNVIAV